MVLNPLDALSLAAAIAQFVDLGVKTASRLHEYNNATHDVPQSFKTINNQLPLLLNSLRRTKEELKAGRVDEETRLVLSRVIDGCREQTELLLALLDKLVPKDDDSQAKVLKKVLVSLKSDGKVASIEKNLQSYVAVLTLYHVVKEPPSTAIVGGPETSYFDVPIMRLTPFVERRNVLGVLDERLKPAATSQTERPLFVSLVGREAAGKTALAVEYCHLAHNSHRFKTIFWADGSSISTLLGSCRRITNLICRSKHTITDAAAIAHFLKSFFEDWWHPWLLVCDDYNEEAYDTLMDIVPTSGQGAVLLISRESQKFRDWEIVVPPYISSEKLIEFRNKLFEAVKTKDESTISEMVQKGIDVNIRDGRGSTPLLTAVERGDESMVKLLLDYGADWRLPRNIGQPMGQYTSLWIAAGSGNLAIIDILLQRENSHPDPQPEMYAEALKAAIGLNQSTPRTSKHVDVVKLLLQQKAMDIDAHGSSVWHKTPLYWAVDRGQVEIVKLLLEKNANIEIADDHNATPLFIAVERGARQMVNLLLDAHADVHTRNDKRQTLLHPASLLADPVIMELLLRHGVNPDLVDEFGQTALMKAAATGRVKTVRVLLESGADPNIQDSLVKDTALIEAVRSNREDVVEILAQHKGINVNLMNRRGDSPIVLAIKKDSKKMTHLLLKAGANLNDRVITDMTPLFYAIDLGHERIVQLILRQNPDFSVSDNKGRTALHRVAEKGMQRAVGDILRHGVEVDFIDSDGNTALMVAAANGHKEIFAELLRKGADVEAVNEFGETVMDLAEENGHGSTFPIMERS